MLIEMEDGLGLREVKDDNPDTVEEPSAVLKIMGKSDLKLCPEELKHFHYFYGFFHRHTMTLSHHSGHSCSEQPIQAQNQVLVLFGYAQKGPECRCNVRDSPTQVR